MIERKSSNRIEVIIKDKDTINFSKKLLSIGVLN